jgi:3-deoxy-D-manno-octulosonate 8-phosphate phosphatase (KDO 8-P phosphatase)
MNPLIEKAQRVKMILLDVDGVMTNGQVWLLPNGDEIKAFSIADGYGIVSAMKLGIKIGIISGRSSASLQQRCEELHIVDVHMNVPDKLKVLNEIATKYQLSHKDIAYIGDDIPDLPVLERVGLSVAPENAHHEVKRYVDLVLRKSGGDGAVREFIDFVLSAQKKVKP